jgi:hypothetical protein
VRNEGRGTRDEGDTPDWKYEPEENWKLRVMPARRGGNDELRVDE